MLFRLIGRTLNLSLALLVLLYLLGSHLAG